MSDRPLNVLQKINKVMGEVSYIQKEKKEGMRYSIVSHDAVTKLLRGPMQKVGIVYYPADLSFEQVGNRTQVRMTVRFANMDDQSDSIDVETMGYGIDDQDKGPGKAVSYAVKYALLKTFGLETGDDPDNDQNASFKPEPKIGVATIEVSTVEGGYANTVSGKRLRMSDQAALKIESGGEYRVRIRMGDKPEILDVVENQGDVTKPGNA